ncbi:hypothetical protein BJ508DRAFT_43729 [Ascobolus immersus RN42]|uniref:Uncharacterized protein n=1 Tax=Ascobolus immersus RN42 TaxID=1160509 RepID=A0A3N4IF92_ASCIM|nr:hypothetical protein BJ508DRAFT_43729 [Ascobolus immersus RN42]
MSNSDLSCLIISSQYEVAYGLIWVQHCSLGILGNGKLEYRRWCFRFLCGFPLSWAFVCFHLSLVHLRFLLGCAGLDGTFSFHPLCLHFVSYLFTSAYFIYSFCL